MSDAERQTYSVAEVARIFGVHKQTVHARIERGEVPHIRFAGRVLVPKWWVDQVIGGATQTGAA